jgi:hypothetical protein
MMAAGAGATPAVAFEGGPDEISFLAKAPPQIAPGGLAQFTIAMRKEESGGHLLYAVRPELSTAEGQETILLRDLDKLEFAYLERAADSPSGRWLNSWRARPALPALVRIRVTFRNARWAPWPELTAAPRIQAAIGCAFDPRLHLCRGS